MPAGVALALAVAVLLCTCLQMSAQAQAPDPASQAGQGPRAKVTNPHGPDDRYMPELPHLYELEADPLHAGV